MFQEVRALIFLSPHHNVFAERARRLRQSFAGHIASAVENIRLIESQRRYTEPLESFVRARHWRYSEQSTPSIPSQSLFQSRRIRRRLKHD